MRKSIIIFVPSLEMGGGAEKVAAILSQILGKKFNIHVLTLFHHQNIYSINGKYLTLNAKKIVINPILRIIKLNRLIKKISPNIILTFMNKTSFWIIPTLYIYKIVVPLLILVNTNPNKHYKKRIYGKFLIRFLYPLKKITKIISVSREQANILVSKYRIPKDKVTTIYNGIEIERIKKLAIEEIIEEKNLYQNSALKFVTMGRLSAEKGHNFLIEAYSQVKIAIPESKLIILGDGPLRTQLKKKIKSLNLENDVFLLGFKKNPYKYIHQADIFVLPSLHEGLPYSLIEALACGTPIISTKCKTGPREILNGGKYGILVEIGNVFDLKNKMIALGEDKHKREYLSKIGLKRAKDFDTEIFQSNWFELIDKFDSSF